MRNGADEVILQRRREAVARLRPLVERDGPDSIWAKFLVEAEALLREVEPPENPDVA